MRMTRNPRDGVLAALLAAALGLGACGDADTISTDALEESIRRELKDVSGIEPTSVECPDEVEVEAGAMFECTATAPDGTPATITATQVDDEGNVDWEVTEIG